MNFGSIPFTLPDSRLGFPLTMATKKETIFRNYRLGEVFDQKGGQCVDAACRGLLLAEPFSQSPCKESEIYKAARKIGNIPDSIEGCTLVHATEYLVNKGIVKKDFWTNDAQEVVTFIGGIAPVLMSIPWYEKMNDPAKDGKLTCKGDPIGFHAVLAFRYDGLKNKVFLRNSWGKSWGLDGNCYVTMYDLTRLMNKGGLACALVE